MSKLIMQKIFRGSDERDKFYLRLCYKDEKYCLHSNVPMSLIKWIKPEITGMLENKHGKSQDEVEMYILFLGHAILERDEAKPHFYPPFVLNSLGYLDRRKLNLYREKVQEFKEFGSDYATLSEAPEICYYLYSLTAQSRLVVEKEFNSTKVPRKLYERELIKYKWQHDYVDAYRQIKGYFKVWSNTEVLQYHVAVDKNQMPIQCLIQRGFLM